MDVMMPLLDMLLFGIVRWVHKPTGNAMGKVLFPNTKFKWMHVSQETVTWIVMMIVAFLLLQYGIAIIAKAHNNESRGAQTQTQQNTTAEKN